MEFIIFLSKLDKEILELLVKANYIVEENTIPFSLDNIQSLKPSKYVLELIAGSSKKFNLYNHSRIINLN